MSRRLLDDFAMTAMHQLLANGATEWGSAHLISIFRQDGVAGERLDQFVARISYDYAEAMVRERSIRLKKGED